MWGHWFGKEFMPSTISVQIDGINYVCTFQYPDGNHIHVPALYIKGNLSCQVVVSSIINA